MRSATLIIMDLKAIANKWQERWEDAHLFEATPDEREKYFLNFPYPYINAYQHLGHLFTLMKVEALARYKRLRGLNVLFPQGWHVTGSPIVQAAKRVKEREPKQLKILKDMKISDSSLPKFEDPLYWIEFFAPEFKKDYKRMGMSIDWRREFFTTSLNPHYDAFVRWQFNKLKERGYVIKGKFPVVWDPKENVPVGDHDRVEGEGETPQEFLLIKHKLDDGRFIVSATLRQDTILGITNLYVHPDIDYVEAIVNGESWILGDAAFTRLEQQGFTVARKGVVNGTDLIGQLTEEMDGHKVPVLPATFLDPKFGTGLVHSVPSDSADDLIALRDLQQDEEKCKAYGLDVAMVRALEPIPVLDTPDYGDVPASALLDKYGVKHQNERAKLDKIKKELYKLSHYTATFNEKYMNVFSENLAGKPVAAGKEIIKRELIERGWAVQYYELTGRVVSRSLSECVVKVVDDQWFVDYANPEWKKKARECLDSMRLYPEKARQQFENVIEWLHEWACTREHGLGTRLPWDEKWLIESLSDSTIYMAYYTIAHRIKELDPEELTDAFFEYVFYGTESDVPALARELREEFLYWYPVDFRNSGKDLIQNHLTFFIFNHVALFPKEHWPQAIGTNGWVTVDGQKMSKSLGNMIPVRDIADEFGPDIGRLTILYGGEQLDDPNWDSSLARTLPARLDTLREFCITHYGKGRVERQQVDAWFASVLNRQIKEITHAMEETLFRTAIQRSFFELTKLGKLYLRKAGTPHKELMEQFIEAQLLLLTPFIPHVTEELWEELGKDGFISTAQWPKFDENLIKPELEAREEAYENIVEDVHTVLSLAQIENPGRIEVFVAEQWKYDFVKLMKEQLAVTSDPKEITAAVMATSLKQHGKEIMKLIPAILKDRSKLPEWFLEKDEEMEQYRSFSDALADVFSCEIAVVDAAKSDEAKARQAMPGKPALLVA